MTNLTVKELTELAESHWSEQNRYEPIGSLTEPEARNNIEDIKKLLTFFSKP